MSVLGCWTLPWFANCAAQCTGVRFRLKLKCMTDDMWCRAIIAAQVLEMYTDNLLWSEIKTQWEFTCNGSFSAGQLQIDVAYLLGCCIENVDLKFEISGKLAADILGGGYTMCAIDYVGL